MAIIDWNVIMFCANLSTVYDNLEVLVCVSL